MFVCVYIYIYCVLAIMKPIIVLTCNNQYQPNVWYSVEQKPIPNTTNPNVLNVTMEQIVWTEEMIWFWCWGDNGTTLFELVWLRQKEIKGARTIQCTHYDYNIKNTQQQKHMTMLKCKHSPWRLAENCFKGKEKASSITKRATVQMSRRGRSEA